MSKNIALPIDVVVGRKAARAALYEMGIWTLGQLTELALDDLLEIPGIGERTAKQIHAQANAHVNNAPFWIDKPPATISSEGIFIDIRVDPDTIPQWPWGFCWRTPNADPGFICVHPSREYTVELQQGWTVQFVPGLNSAWKLFAAQLLYETREIYFWGKVVLTHLQQTSAPDIQAQLKPRLVDLHKVFTDIVALPIKSTGLQPVAKYLGIEWADAKAPFEAHIPYLLWLEKQQPKFIQTACDYMLRNTEAVEHIWRWMLNEGE